jgi:uncharacterized protein (TIGR00290 family)
VAGAIEEGRGFVKARTPVVVSWSGGKDSALLVNRLRESDAYDVVGLLTTVTAEYDRISIHGIRRDILRAQVTQLGIPLHEVVIPAAASNAIYEEAFANALAELRTNSPHVRTIAFGDLFLEDVRAYRERLLAALNWDPLFPLWALDTRALARQFVRDRFRAIVCCVDTTQLAPAWAGREFDSAFLDSLPGGIDPCGERGEFHTCVYDAPIFSHAIVLERGERVRRDARFEYCDLRISPRQDATHAAVLEGEPRDT